MDTNSHLRSVQMDDAICHGNKAIRISDIAMMLRLFVQWSLYMYIHSWQRAAGMIVRSIISIPVSMKLCEIPLCPISTVVGDFFSCYLTWLSMSGLPKTPWSSVFVMLSG